LRWGKLKNKGWHMKEEGRVNSLQKGWVVDFFRPE